MEQDEKFALKWIIIIAIFLVITSIGLWASQRTVEVVDNGIIHYEEFQEIYNTTKQVNSNLCVIRKLPENDPMFTQFSKIQRIAALQLNMNRWVEEYNAKSKMINRSLWKSSDLPYQLNTTDFSCY